MANFRIYNDILCPDLWDRYLRLDSKIRANLLQMAYDFYEKTKFPAPIIDVYLMGSISNYNWTAESDIDVHVIIDYSKLQMPEETANKAVKTAGSQWNSEHSILIKSHKVEMNIQNIIEKKPYVTGIYSLVKNKWIRQPFKMPPQIDKNILRFQYEAMKKYVQNVIASKDRGKMKAAKKYIDAYRQYGLDTYGELSYENIVFKVLRSRGLIKKLKDSITAVYDQEMSVNEIGEKDINQTLPGLSIDDSPEFGNPKFSRSYWDKTDKKSGEFRLGRLTMSELKALREKAFHLAREYTKHNKPQWAEYCKKNYEKYDSELQRRIRTINAPITESPLITKKGNAALSGDRPLKDKNVEEVIGNIVVIRQGKGGGFLAEGWTLVYFMDSDESAQAMKNGEISYLMVPRGTYMGGGSPITDIWKKKFQKPGTEHILGVIEGHSDDKSIFIDMITVRPGWKRNHIAKLMIDRLRKTFPEAKLTTSTQTDAGQKLFKGYDSALEFIGDCKNKSLVDSIFGSVSEFARQVETHGDNFEYRGIVIKYDSKTDVHSFWKRPKLTNEGYGSGIPEKDRLKIKNTDGSTRRWQIRSKDAPKTPKMRNESSDIFNPESNRFQTTNSIPTPTPTPKPMVSAYVIPTHYGGHMDYKIVELTPSEFHKLVSYFGGTEENYWDMLRKWRRGHLYKPMRVYFGKLRHALDNINVNPDVN